MLGAAAAAWGIAGVVGIITRAVARLVPHAVEGFTTPLLPWHWAALAGWVGFMVYFEGYKGFQRAFSPRVVLRALHLARNPRPLHALLAPLYVMGLIHASRRRLVTGWLLVATMVGLVLGVRHVAQPVRGLIDVGVILGLVWGVAAIFAFLVGALTGRPPRGSLDLPASPSAQSNEPETENSSPIQECGAV
jgi:hypothetical protein